MKILILFLFLAVVSGEVMGAQSTDAGPSKASKEGIGNREADDSVRVIGTLPYSNQWTFERPNNFLYLNYEQETLASQSIYVSHFATQYSGKQVSLLSLDFFSRLLSLADPLGNSFLRRFSIWGRYKLGMGLQQGSLFDDTSQINLTAEKSSLLLLMGELELTLSFDWSDWIQPFIGFGYKPYYFRNSSSLSSAEMEGGSSLYGPSLGVHLPVLFSHRGSIFAEVRQDTATSSSNQILFNAFDADFGAGLVF